MWFRGAVQVYSFLEKKTMKGGRAFVRFLCVRSRLNYPGWAYGEALDGYEVLFWYHSMQKFLWIILTSVRGISLSVMGIYHASPTLERQAVFG